jgi:hypothetical protein
MAIDKSILFQYAERNVFPLADRKESSMKLGNQEITWEQVRHVLLWIALLALHFLRGLG